MTQAIGRAKRFGQKKVIHIYHFLVAYTVDIDLFERLVGKQLIVKSTSTPAEMRPYPSYSAYDIGLADYRPEKEERRKSKFSSSLASRVFENDDEPDE